jgi:hypothetical protein
MAGKNWCEDAVYHMFAQKTGIASKCGFFDKPEIVG